MLRARAAAYAAGYLNDKSYFQITLDETAQLVASAPQLADFDKLFVTGCEDLDEVILVRRYSLDATNSWGNWYNQSIGGYCVTTPVKALADAFEYVGERNETMPYLNKDPRFYQTIYAPGMEMRASILIRFRTMWLKKMVKLILILTRITGLCKTRKSA